MSRVSRLASLALLLACSPIAAQQSSSVNDLEKRIGQQLPNASDHDGLRITVATVQPKNVADKRLRFAIALQNISENDQMLNLGMMHANGKKQYPTGIDLFLSDEKGNVKKLLLGEPNVAGRVDDYIVPLSVDATYTVVVSLDQYWCPATSEFRINLLKGTYKIVAAFKGQGAQYVNGDMRGVALMQYWMGKAVSEPLEFIVPTDWSPTD